MRNLEIVSSVQQDKCRVLGQATVPQFCHSVLTNHQRYDHCEVIEQCISRTLLLTSVSSTNIQKKLQKLIQSFFYIQSGWDLYKTSIKNWHLFETFSGLMKNVKYLRDTDNVCHTFVPRGTANRRCTKVFEQQVEFLFPPPPTCQQKSWRFRNSCSEIFSFSSL